MESKKVNLSKILSVIITSVSLLLAGIFLAICFWTPTPINVKALTKDDILRDNIYFVSSKTKFKYATSITRYTGTDYISSDNSSFHTEGAVESTFEKYAFDYQDWASQNTNLQDLYYYGQPANKLYGSEYAQIAVSTGNEESLAFKKYGFDKSILNNANDFIPKDVNYFENVKGELEEIFYDEADNNDFVVLDNNKNFHSNHVANNKFNVENFYLAFGSPYSNELTGYHSTPLHELRVEARLYTKDRVHILNLNQVNQVQISAEPANKNVSFWYQYFDLNNLQGKKSAESNSDIYQIDDQEGRYEFIFRFIKYDENLEPASQAQEEFKYSFYLLDSSNYNNYPTMHNASLGSVALNRTNEYFYNFTNDSPYIEYDPSKYNISYERENKEIKDNITSSFATTTYTHNGIKYPKGVISYYNNGTKFKDVHILVNDGNNETSVEYLYLIDYNNYASNCNTYEGYVSLLDNDQIFFDYKVTDVLTTTIEGNTTTYQTKKYLTTSYDNYPLFEESPRYDNNDISTYTYIKQTVASVDSYYINNTSDTNNILAIGNNTITLENFRDVTRLDVIPVKYSYKLNFEELGVYNFSYNYVCPALISSINKKVSYDINNSKLSTNVTTPTNVYYLATAGTPIPSETTTSKEYYISLSGYLNAENRVTLNGIEFTYNSTNRQLTYNDTNQIFNTSSSTLTLNEYLFGSESTTVNETSCNTTFQIDNINGLRLTVKIQVGNIDITESTSASKYQLNGIDYYIDSNTNTTIPTSSILNPIASHPEWAQFNGALNIYTDKIVSHTTQSAVQGKDILHIFGSISYFNKEANTDSTFAKLQQIDAKTNKNYVSDVTKEYLRLNNSATRTIEVENDYNQETFQGFSTDIFGNTSNKINAKNIIVTDVAPVLWKNLSTLLYTNTNKISRSYIYRYDDYTIGADGSLTLGNPTISTYTKDTYCQFDGLYEIVVAYKYDNYKPDNDTIFYQLFTFIINHSSPKVTIQVSDPKTPAESKVYTDLGLNKYTNQDVRISWDVPTYFQNDVYLDIEKKYFNNYTNDNFKATYRQKQITTLSGNSTYVTSITSMQKGVVDGKEKYFVDISLPSQASAYNLNGNYTITLHYSTSGTSTITENFVIDRMNISGMSLYQVNRTGDGKYSVDNINTPISNQITNKPFTFRYAPKPSGAEIYTYYYKIELSSLAEATQTLKTINNEIGVTTDFYVDGNRTDFNSGIQYLYNTEVTTSRNTEVSANNYFKTNNSCLYLFEMEDQAGNHCRYIVFYDVTTPKFLVAPEIDNPNSIVQDITKITWGDYKAIKVGKDIDELANFESLDNYNNYNDDENIFSSNDKLADALMYMNSVNKFDNLKVEQIGDWYYILIPITSVELEDRNSSGGNVELLNGTGNNNVRDFYFFPVNPLSNNNTILNLPAYNSNGSVVYIDEDHKIMQTKSYAVDNFSVTQMVNSYNETFERYITINYSEIESPEIKYTLKGVIGIGVFYYSVFDNLFNYSKGKIWMNLDKTQTLAYGLFDYSEDISKAVSLSSDNDSPSSYATSRLYMTSLESNIEAGIPEYTVSYRYFGYDTQFYENNEISSIRLVDSNSEITDPALMTNNTSIEYTYTNGKVVRVNLTADMRGNKKVLHTPSYPYTLDGNYIIADAHGQPADIYSYDGNTASYRNSQEPSRIFTNTINANTDANLNKIVTQEGLYIFKRTYTTANDEDLGYDSKTIYIPYYVDRNGIINISSNASISDKLYNIGADIDFTIGYQTDDYKVIDALSIQNNQSSKASIYSNADNSSNNLFTTNKIIVDFRLTADKFNFEDFYETNNQAYLNKINNNEQLRNALGISLFNSQLYSSRIYKLDLSISKGEQFFIDENNAHSTQKFNSSYISKYLKDCSDFSTQHRSNEYKFFFGDTIDQYIINLNDQSGYDLVKDNNVITNYNPNKLNISFSINHKAPAGETYGKYYGRHERNYDESLVDSISPSIPIDNNGTYLLISKYLSEGQLQPLSDVITSTTSDINGSYVRVASTNNETLVFLFKETNDDYQAKIDINNITVYQGGTIVNGNVVNGNIIFNKVNGHCQGSNMVTADRMTRSFISNKIGNVTYHAIILFDNNLDDILDPDETNYSYLRLLDKAQNIDNVDYFIKINYIGDRTGYVSETNGKTYSYYSTIYQTRVDREKPKYNLTKLMAADRYVYNEVSDTLTTANYESVFEKYKKYYNFGYRDEFDIEKDFERSDLENYFFAVDYREDTGFSFESVDVLDFSKSFFFRAVDFNNYKFSITPDDYKAYYDSLYLQGYPQFTPSKAITITTSTRADNIQPDVYYQVYFTLVENNNSNSISVKYLLDKGIFNYDNYYEIIEHDEAGNYRVYGIYIPSKDDTSVTYKYKINNNSPEDTRIISGNTRFDPTVTTPTGMNLYISNYITKDLFIKANLIVNSTKLKESISIYYNPHNDELYVTDAKNKILNMIATTYDPTGSYTEDFIKLINDYINDYHTKISDKNSTYYSQYGYNIKIEIINRIGIIYSKQLLNFEINYAAAGSILAPIFTDGQNSFTLTIPALTGTTYITNIKVYEYNNGWTQKASDVRANTYSKLESELKNGFVYTLTRGVYKVEITDNFSRTNTYYHEFGISSSTPGGSLKFNSSNKLNDDGFTYTGNEVYYTYDSSVYNIIIHYTGKAIKNQDGDNVETGNYVDIPIYSSEGSYLELSEQEFEFIEGGIYSDEDKARFGIKSIIQTGVNTTITFTNVATLSKFHIKTIIASTASEHRYEWNDEAHNSDLVVYNKKFAIYTGIQDVGIKNLNGTSLSTQERLNLTEDFELITTWANTNVEPADRKDFNTKIVLTRTYLKNGQLINTTNRVSSGYLVKEPGEYTAYAINDLGYKSKTISFTRGEGEITMYAVYKVDVNGYEQKLSPSTYITSDSEHQDKLVFTYFATNDYFSYKDTSILENDKIDIDNITTYLEDPELSNKLKVDTSRNYVDVRVNSNLSIFTQLYKMGIDDDSRCPYVQYEIYSKKLNSDTSYTYRFIKIIFVDNLNTKLASAMVTNNNSTETSNLLGENETISIIKSTSSSVNVTFSFYDNSQLLNPIGDNIFIDRYYNGELISTTNLEMSDIVNIPLFSIDLYSVGLHKFVIRDLAGRVHKFGNDNALQIYLINQILYTVNNKTPINNQIFNESVTIQVQSDLAGLTLYNSRALGITITKNGKNYTMPNNEGLLVFNEPGYYNVKVIASTVLSDGTASVSDQEIVSNYNFVIIDTHIAQKSFNISKGTGFTIDKVTKTSEGETYDVTQEFHATGNNLLWLTFDKSENENSQVFGNGLYEITLKSYDDISKSYIPFSFKVWINDEEPVIISSIPNGSSTKDLITINYNPGLIYSQVGKCKVLLNNKVITTIDENSQVVVDTISLEQTGTYWIKIVSEDDTLISSYKFTKNQPINNTTRIVLIGGGIGVVVLVIAFFLIRKKGKYR